MIIVGTRIRGGRIACRVSFRLVFAHPTRSANHPHPCTGKALFRGGGGGFDGGGSGFDGGGGGGEFDCGGGSGGGSVLVAGVMCSFSI
jgi:hypothetical protein